MSDTNDRVQREDVLLPGYQVDYTIPVGTVTDHRRVTGYNLNGGGVCLVYERMGHERVQIALTDDGLDATMDIIEQLMERRRALLELDVVKA